MSNNLVADLRTARLKAWESAKTINEDSITEGRDGTLDAEGEAAWLKANADIDQLDQRIAGLIDAETRDQAATDALGAAGLRASVAPEVRTVTADPAAEFRAFARGESAKSMDFGPESRDILKSSTGAPVPTSFYDKLVQHMVQVGPMLQLATVLNTASGENLQIPRTTAFSTAAITGEGAAIAESDPTFGAFVTLGAFKYSFITQLSTEMIDDAGVDVLGFLAEQTGIAMGVKVNTDLTVGTGSAQPRGLALDTTLGVTGGAAVVGAFTADNLIDLVYSVNSAYRAQPGCGFQMRDASIAATRKLKDSSGRYLFEPSLQAGQPDTLLGFRLDSNPDVAATAVNARSVLFGVTPKYFVRQVGGVRLDRSDEFAFNAGLVTFRATLRVDGALADLTGAVRHFVGAAT